VLDALLEHELFNVSNGTLLLPTTIVELVSVTNSTGSPR